MSNLVKRSFSLAGHRTSVALEPQFWSVLEAIATERSEPLLALITQADAGRAAAIPLASTLRVLALQNVSARTTGAPALTID